MLLNLTDLSAEPLYRQISSQLTERIIERELAAGDELPPLRVLAREHRVSKNTVKRAYDELARHGLIAHGSGERFVVAGLTEGVRHAVSKYRSKGHESQHKAIRSLSRKLLLGPGSDRVRSPLVSNISNRIRAYDVHVALPDTEGQSLALTSPGPSERTCEIGLDDRLLERHEIEEELRMAHQLQADLLPGEWDNGKGLSLAAYTSPCRAVGGDLYDYFPIDDAHVGLVVADASGKGMPAAILISQIQAILKTGVANGDTIARTLSSLNGHLERNTPARYFVTLFYGTYSRKTGCLEYANAGHDFPIVVRADGEVDALESTGPALGVLPEYDHKTGTSRVEPGDCILFYTDGITDATDTNGKQYGEQRLKNLLICNRHRTPRKIIDLIRDDLEEFCGPGAHQDDRTLMVLKVENTDERESDAA
jgi:DNA-binding transcriptional regulator YhcF (GntR family)